VTIHPPRTLLALAVVAALAAIALPPGNLHAQEGAAWHPRNEGFAAGLVANIPNADFGRRSQTGFGIQGFYVRPLLPLVTVTASAGYNRFPGEGELPAADVWSFTGGLRFEFGAFYMSGEGGYYTEIDEGGFVPGIGLHLGRFEAAARWKASGNSTWTSLRLGYYF
jgi:hypothetical protein